MIYARICVPAISNLIIDILPAVTSFDMSNAFPYREVSSSAPARKLLASGQREFSCRCRDAIRQGNDERVLREGERAMLEPVMQRNCSSRMTQNKETSIAGHQRCWRELITLISKRCCVYLVNTNVCISRYNCDEKKAKCTLGERKCLFTRQFCVGVNTQRLN